jgi:hypothetical protein
MRVIRYRSNLQKNCVYPKAVLDLAALRARQWASVHHAEVESFARQLAYARILTGAGLQQRLARTFPQPKPRALDQAPRGVTQRQPMPRDTAAERQRAVDILDAQYGFKTFDSATQRYVYTALGRQLGMDPEHKPAPREKSTTTPQWVFPTRQSKKHAGVGFMVHAFKVSPSAI